MAKRYFFAFILLAVFVWEACKTTTLVSINLDEKYLSRHDTLDHGQNLDGNTVLRLTSNLIMPDSTVFDFNSIANFLKIDSLKKNGKYKHYTNNLEIGMVADADAFILDSLFYEDTNALLWAVKNASFEACPYSKGIDLFLTFFDKGQITKTAKVASKFHFSDPPIAFESLLTANIKESEIILRYQDKNFAFIDNEDEFKVVEEKSLRFRFDLEKEVFTLIQ